MNRSDFLKRLGIPPESSLGMGILAIDEVTFEELRLLLAQLDRVGGQSKIKENGMSFRFSEGTLKGVDYDFF